MISEKPVIDDAMVARAVLARNAQGESYRESFEATRLVLLAALTVPPPETEIDVSEAMKQAGANAYNKHALGCPNAVVVPLSFGALAAAYRAMERERLKTAAAEPAAQPAPAPDGFRHRRFDDLIVCAVPVTLRHERTGRRACLQVIHHNGHEFRVHGRCTTKQTAAHRRVGDP